MTGVGRVGDGGNVHCQEFANRISCLSSIRGVTCFLLQRSGSPLLYGCRLPVSGAAGRGHGPSSCMSPCVPLVSGLLIVLPSPPSSCLSLSLCPCFSPSPPCHFSPLLLCSPDPSPEDVHFAFCEFSTSPPSQCPLPLQRHNVTPRSTSSLTPPRLRRSWLACSLRAHPPEVLQSPLSL